MSRLRLYSSRQCQLGGILSIDARLNVFQAAISKLHRTPLKAVAVETVVLPATENLKNDGLSRHKDGESVMAIASYHTNQQVAQGPALISVIPVQTKSKSAKHSSWDYNTRTSSLPQAATENHSMVSRQAKAAPQRGSIRNDIRVCCKRIAVDQILITADANE